jgi:DNA-binding SARP family transcriptional activator
VHGRFVVTVADRAVNDDPPWGSRKAQHLVKLLALAPGHRLPIDQLLDALWPDLDPAAARRAYYQALYLACRALDPDHLGLLTSRQQSSILEAPCGAIVDFDRFRAAANTRGLAASGSASSSAA